MNLHFYWSRPLATLIRSNILFVTDYYRPMGGVFYRGIYSLAGFHPLPFRLAAFTLLIANMFLWYSVARRLARSREIAGLSVLLSSFHAGLIELYFDTGAIYDILCYFFYFSAFLYYLRIRQRQVIPGVVQTSIFLLLYVASINSKEMGISLPIMILAYEVIWHYPSSVRREVIRKWVLAEGRTAFIAAAFTVAFIIGKATGPESLANHPAYKPEISWMKYFESSAHYMGILFYRNHDLWWKEGAVILFSMLVVALVSHRRHSLWSVAMVLFGILPMAFVAPRNGFAVYIPVAGWALYAASLIVIVKDWLISRLMPSSKNGKVAAMTGETLSR